MAEKRVHFFRKSEGSDVEQLIGSTEAEIDHDSHTIEFRGEEDWDLKEGDLVSSRLIAAQPIRRVVREEVDDETEYRVWWQESGS